jgi:HAD superfamily hydrolase (TIGR01509 family)
VPEADITALRAARNRIYAELLRTEPLEVSGAREVLEALHGRVAMGVVTSSRREHFELIHTRTGFGRFFDFVVTGDDLDAAKPDPEPYRRALALSGLRPEECLAIEDSARGLAAAKAAGIACWVIPNALTRGSDFRAADRLLASISEVPRLLETTT